MFRHEGMQTSTWHKISKLIDYMDIECKPICVKTDLRLTDASPGEAVLVISKSTLIQYCFTLCA